MSGHVKIPRSVPSVRYLADGVVAAFPFHFPLFAAEDMAVLVDASRIDQGFRVESDDLAEGGEVLFDAPPPAGASITLQRELPIERMTDFQPSAALRADNLNDELDRLVAMLQQIDRDLGRAVRVHPHDGDAELLLPVREVRAGQLLAFDAAGGLTTQAEQLAERPDWPNLDTVPEGLINKHFTAVDKTRLADLQANLVPMNRVSVQEKSEGSEAQLRAFAPKDVADMARVHAPAGMVGSVFGRLGSVSAHAGDYTADQIAETASKVIMTQAERARIARCISVTEFGAVGDGLTDDTPAFVAAAAHVAAHKRALHIPAGTYLLKQRIDFVNCPLSLIGDGLSLSILRWTADATSLGIRITANSDTQFHHIRDLGFQVAKKGGTAIVLDYTGQVDFGVFFPGKIHTLDRQSPRFLIENCFFRGSGTVFTTGWDIGVDSITAIKGTVFNCSFTGWQVGSPPASNSPLAFRFRGIDSSFENGHPCEFVVANCSVYQTDTAVVFDGIEGGFVQFCNFTGVWTAVQWECGFGRPQLNVANCQFNVYRFGIVSSNCNELTAMGNLIYGVIDATAAVTGIRLGGTPAAGGSSWFVLQGNTFENTSQTQGFNAIIIDRGSRGVIDANVFRTATTAIWLTPNASFCKVGGMNVYAPAPAVGTPILNQGAGNTIIS